MMADTASTLRLFQHDRVAEGYASARPFLHPRVFALVRDLIRPAPLFRRALDVGCGTGMSSVALLEMAHEVIGVDGSQEMLRRARHAGHIHYAAACAEALPFTPGSFDVVVACGSIDWVDRSRFLPVVAELLEPGGWLVPLDFGDQGQSRRVPALHQWYRDVFLRHFPRPPSADPIIQSDEAARHGFAEPVTHQFELPWRFDSRRYADFLLTESSVIAAVEHGSKSAAEVRAWLVSELTPLLGREEQEIDFGGYIQLLQRM